MKSPHDRDLQGVSPPVDEFNWRQEEFQFDDLPQHDELVLRSSRVFIVENDIWMNTYPQKGHERWWDEDLSEHYPRHFEDDGWSQQPIVLRISQQPDITVIEPMLDEARNDTIVHLAQFLRQIDVPEDTPIHWEAGVVSHQSTAGDYYGQIR